MYRLRQNKEVLLMPTHTPLYQVHQEHGAKLVDYSGYEMPIQYTGIIAEHLQVRKSGGIFDLCHMGEILVSGAQATEFLNYVTTNDVSGLKPGAIQYTLITNEQGGVIDDILVYREEQGYYLVVNSTNRHKDYAWLVKHAQDQWQVTVADLSDQTALVAVQGPNSLHVVNALLQTDLQAMSYYSFVDLEYNKHTVRVSRTGYTGEDGFELYFAPEIAVEIWKNLLLHGQPYEIVPIGLGARDTLRLEMRMPLYGNELTEEITPVEAGLSKFVNLDKGDFIGRAKIASQVTNGTQQRLIGFKLADKGIPRHGYDITDGQNVIGVVTSGTISPSTGGAIGMGYVQTEHAATKQPLYVQIRKQQALAKLVKGRFVQVKK